VTAYRLSGLRISKIDRVEDPANDGARILLFKSADVAKKDRPSIKRDDVYEALRRRGYSKERAARIANAVANGTIDRVRKATPDDLDALIAALADLIQTEPASDHTPDKEEGTVPDTNDDDTIEIDRESLSEEVRAYLDRIEADAKAAAELRAELDALRDMDLDTLAALTGLVKPDTDEDGTPAEDDDVLVALAKSHPEAAAEIRKAREAAAQAHAEVMKMRRNAQRERFVAKARGDLGSLTGTDADKADALLAIADAVGEDSETFRTVERLLKAAAAQAQEATTVLARSQGTSGGGKPSDAYEAVMGKAREIAKSTGKTIDAAIGDVFAAHPDLFAEYEADRADRR